MTPSRRWTWILFVALLVAGAVFAQRRFRGGGYGRGYYYDNSSASTAREIPQHGGETPTWTNAPGFEKDVFTFVRIKRSGSGRATAEAPGTPTRRTAISTSPIASSK